ncbi:hypothetical protein D9M71_327300 [compost metagenome]
MARWMSAPRMSTSRSCGSLKKRGSINGAALGSLLASLTVPRLLGRSRVRWQLNPCHGRSLRAWSSTIAGTKISCRSGIDNPGWLLKNAPDSAKGEVTRPLRSRFHWAMALSICQLNVGEKPKVWVLSLLR